MDAARFRLGSESERTYRLKWAAWEWRYNTAGCRCIGFEARRRGPWGRIVDMAAVGPGNRVYAVEVKSRRADFARNNHTDADVAPLRKRAAALSRRIALAETPGYCSRNDDRERLAWEWERLATISTKFHDPRFFPAAARLLLHYGANRGRSGQYAAAAVGTAGRSAVGGGRGWGHIGTGTRDCIGNLRSKLKSEDEGVHQERCNAGVFSGAGLRATGGKTQYLCTLRIPAVW